MRSLVDLWSSVTRTRLQLAALLRGDLNVAPWLSAALWFTLRDRSIGKQSRGECFDRPASAVVTPDTDAPAPQTQNPLDPDFALDSPQIPSRTCTGERFTLSTRLHWTIHRRVWLAMQYRHGFTDDPETPSGIRHSAVVGITLGAQPIDGLSLTSRWRYADGDLHHHAHQPAYLRGYTAIGYRVRPWLQPGVAYELRMLTDGRPSSVTRVPNPEHWLWFDLRARF